MPARPVHRCLCALCQREETAATRAHHEQMNLVLSRLDERKRQVSVHGEQRVRLLGYPDPRGRSLCEEKDHAVP